MTNRFHPSNGYRFLYVRDRQDNPVGVIASTAAGSMGWSLCKRKLDRFTKTEAKELACDPARMRDIPRVQTDLRVAGVNDTPMNRTLCALSNDMDVPHTIRQAARQALESRRASND